MLDGGEKGLFKLIDNDLLKLKMSSEAINVNDLFKFSYKFGKLFESVRGEHDHRSNLMWSQLTRESKKKEASNERGPIEFWRFGSVSY